MNLDGELSTLRDLAAETEYDVVRPATGPQLGRISEIFRRILGENPPRLVRVRAIALLYGYSSRMFRTTEQLSTKGAGAFITWAFVPHQADADLNAVPLREGAAATIRWAIDEARASILPAELAEDEERNRAIRRQYAQERARKKREAASLSHQG